MISYSKKIQEESVKGKITQGEVQRKTDTNLKESSLNRLTHYSLNTHIKCVGSSLEIQHSGFLSEDGSGGICCLSGYLVYFLPQMWIQPFLKGTLVYVLEMVLRDHTLDTVCAHYPWVTYCFWAFQQANLENIFAFGLFYFKIKYI